MGREIDMPGIQDYHRYVILLYYVLIRSGCVMHKSEDRFVDMHIHILPGIDDGSQSMETTIEMLRIAQKSGTTDMIVTPHFKNGHHNAGYERIVSLIDKVTAVARDEGIDINLYPGNELLYYDGCADDIVAGKICSMNDTDRVLVEFFPGERATYIRNAVDAIISVGFVPIVAHVERYECTVANPELVYELKRMGAEIQINAASVEGKLGLKIKKYVAGLLRDEVVDYIGTDAHDSKRRIPDTRKCMAVLRKICDEQYIENITYNNAMDIISAD